MSPLVVDAGNHPVTAEIDWQPEGVVVKTGSVLGLMTVKVKSDPARFREFIESRDNNTGAWRGDVEAGS